MVITTDKDKLTRPLNFILKKARTPSADGNRKQVGTYFIRKDVIVPRFFKRVCMQSISS